MKLLFFTLTIINIVILFYLVKQISSKDEDFFDLQVDIDEHTSITHCLKCYSNTETLCSDNKFKCDKCNSYQEAQVRIHILL